MNIRKLEDLSWYKDKRILITGLTGFKGSWLAFVLSELGSKIKGISLEPKTNPSLFNEFKGEVFLDNDYINICNYEKFYKSLIDFKPDVIFHLAAQALVLEAAKNPLETYQSNIMGTVNLLEACNSLPSLKSLVLVTTDKVYKDSKKLIKFSENDQLGGNEPYSTSKVCSELIIKDFHFSNRLNDTNSFGITVLRAGNVIGGGDWSANRLIPDIFKAWSKKESLIIRNPNHIRPWQHVLETTFAYLKSGIYAALHKNKEVFNIGPNDEAQISVKEILEYAKSKIDLKKISYEESENIETELLALDNTKIKNKVNIKPVLGIYDTLDFTFEWYLNFYSKKNPYNLCLRDLKKYLKLL